MVDDSNESFTSDDHFLEERTVEEDLFVEKDSSGYHKSNRPFILCIFLF